MNNPIFLSHCSHDKEIVIRLRQALEAQKLPVWMVSCPQNLGKSSKKRGYCGQVTSFSLQGGF